MWNSHSLSDRQGQSWLSWETAVVLLRASAIAIVLLAIIVAYTKPLPEARLAGATSRADNVAAQSLTDKLAACEQRYAAENDGADGPPYQRADAVLADCIESEP